MLDYLVIVESPKKVKHIQKYLGSDYKVLATKGHVREIAKEEKLKAINDDFTIKYNISKSAKPFVNDIVSNAKNKKVIYLCTDPDREGEGIAWHIMEILKSKGIKGPFQRVVFHEITEKAVKEAFKHPRDIDTNLLYAQQARQALDYLLGFSLSPVLWNSVEGAKSAGRVQSPALRLIEERDLEIKNFKPEEYWSIHLKTEKDNIPFIAKLHSLRGLNSKVVISNEKEAKAIIEKIGKGKVQVTNIKQKQVKRKPKAPFITTTMQKDVFRKLGWSTDYIMSRAQDLFGNGHITYMRTDSTTLSQEAIDNIKKTILDTYGEDYLSPETRIYDKKAANAQEAHEAIRPTDFFYTPERIKPVLEKQDRGNSDDNLKLYRIIYQRALASQMTDAIFDSTTVEMLCGEGIFRVSGSTPVFPGYLAVYEESNEEDSNNQQDDNQKLPKLEIDDLLPNNEVYPEQHFTSPPPRFNEASLVDSLEKLGIGRPSTYASIIKTLKSRDYVDNSQRKMESTDIGKRTTEFLKERFPDYVSYDFTAKMEDNLDKLSRGELSYISVMTDFKNKLSTDIRIHKEKQTTGTSTEESCPVCQSSLILKEGLHGKYYKCSNQECQYKRSFEKKEVKYLDEQCPECNKPLVERISRKTGKPFIACSGYPDCKYIKKDRPDPIDTGETCERCGKGHILLCENEKGQYKKCSHYVPKKFRKKKKSYCTYWEAI